MLSNLLSKLVAFTHGKLYTDWITHAPLAATLVLWKHTWWMLAIPTSIGFLKNLVIDRKYQADWNSTDAWTAVTFYSMGSALGWILGL